MYKRQAKKGGAGKTVTITAKAADGSGVRAKVKIRIDVYKRQGTLFGFYPAYKASKLVPVEALGAE